jgi:hypothetical protein
VRTRLEAAALHYPDRWRDFIKATSAVSPYWQRRGRGFAIGHKYLVDYLLLVGQIDHAVAVTDELVSTFVNEVRDQPIVGASWFI